MNDMGDPLDHGFNGEAPEETPARDDIPVAGPSRVHAAESGGGEILPSDLDITEVKRGGEVEVRSVSPLLATKRWR